jgi:hypothetical protein
MVKINHSNSKNSDDIIDLRGARKEDQMIESETLDDEPEFQITSMEDDGGSQMGVKSSPIHEADINELRTSEYVKVKFDKFATLVATHASQEMLEECRDEEVIVSTNLLTDLANTEVDKGESKKVPLVFLVGIILGIGLTWFLLKS